MIGSLRAGYLLGKMELPRGAEAVSLLDYARLNTQDRGDLYLTRFGVPFREHLAPENWYAPEHTVIWIQPDRSLLRRRTGDLAYALVDYELIERIENSQCDSSKLKESCVP